MPGGAVAVAEVGAVGAIEAGVARRSAGGRREGARLLTMPLAAETRAGFVAVGARRGGEGRRYAGAPVGGRGRRTQPVQLEVRIGRYGGRTAGAGLSERRVTACVVARAGGRRVVVG